MGQPVPLRLDVPATPVVARRGEEVVLRDPKSAAVPGELEPEDAVFAVLKENERRFPWAVHTGWRARMRSN